MEARMRLYGRDCIAQTEAAERLYRKYPVRKHGELSGGSVNRRSVGRSVAAESEDSDTFMKLEKTMFLHRMTKFTGGITMNKAELIAAVAEKTELSKKDAEKALKAFTDVVAEQLKKGDKVQLVGFGTFEVSERAAREGRNPQTGETMTIAASRTPKFKAGKALKDMMNE